MSEHLFLVTIAVIALTCLLIFGMKAFSALSIAKAHSSREEDYRNLSLRTVTANTEISAQLASLLDKLREVKERVAKIEKILKDVD
jgi:hypothetical protein